MVRMPTATPAEVIVREVADLAYGDRVLHFRRGLSWAEFVTGLGTSTDGSYMDGGRIPDLGMPVSLGKAMETTSTITVGAMEGQGITP